VPDITSVRRKIRGLLRMAAPGSGATEAERATAQSLVGKLMKRYGISEAQLNERDRVTVVFHFTHVSTSSTHACYSDNPTFTWGFCL
jgi:uncharacterized protein YlxP (DUF503 family)